MIIDINPCSKPRMTVSDRWKKRKCVLKYHAFRDEIRLQTKDIDFPGELTVCFFVPMPKSWSKKKRKEMLLKPHQQRPDIDNFEKGLLDAIYEEDSIVWNLWSRKYWSEAGSISIEFGVTK